jgi:hypothetical protein
MELPIEADVSHVVAATLPTSWMSAPALNHFYETLFFTAQLGLARSKILPLFRVS